MVCVSVTSPLITFFLGLGRPYLSEHAFKITAEYAFYLFVTVFTTDESIGQIEHPFWMIEPFNIDLFAKRITSFVTSTQLLV